MRIAVNGADDLMMEQANYDTLTRLPNRFLLQDRIALFVGGGKHHKSRIAVLVIDLDCLKLVNDSLGYKVGDILLQSVARRLEGCVRASDFLARLGGDEFVIVLSDIETPDEIIPIIERCQETLADIFKIDHHVIAITSSIGVSIFPTDGKDVNTLLKNADAALQTAKRKGPNCFSFYKPPSKAQAAAFEKILKAKALSSPRQSNNVIPLKPRR